MSVTKKQTLAKAWSMLGKPHPWDNVCMCVCVYTILYFSHASLILFLTLLKSI